MPKKLWLFLCTHKWWKCVPGQLVSLNRPKDGVHMHMRSVAYQDQKASMNANHAKVNTRPYILMGFKPGIERAFRLIGLTSGARHRVVTSYMASKPNEQLLAGGGPSFTGCVYERTSGPSRRSREQLTCLTREDVGNAWIQRRPGRLLMSSVQWSRQTYKCSFHTLLRDHPAGSTFEIRRSNIKDRGRLTWSVPRAWYARWCRVCRLAR